MWRGTADPAILAATRRRRAAAPPRASRPAIRPRSSGLALRKTEAWVIVDAVPDAVVHLGFARDVDPDELAGWVTTQQIAPMLAATNRVPVRRGDAILIPAGLPHAIGPGIFFVEVRARTDFSVLLEPDGFPLGSTDVGRSRHMDHGKMQVRALPDSGTAENA